jgi:chromatin segregation and condensation protein Rec8/ScpA/Scc1 (kleisin family)
MVGVFAQMENTTSHQFARPGTKLDGEELLEFDSALLALVLKEIKDRRTETFYVVERPKISIEDMIKILSEELARERSINLVKFLARQPSVPVIIGLFIGALELVRVKRAQIIQEEPFGEILLERCEA